MQTKTLSLKTPLQKGMYNAERAENAEIFCRFRKEKALLMRILQIFNSARSAFSALNGFCSRVLKTKRQVSFEEIVLCIEMGFLLDILEHPNQEKYQGQKFFVIQVDNYAYLVPFVENEREVFWKTIIPSRKATRKYLKGCSK